MPRGTDAWLEGWALACNALPDAGSLGASLAAAAAAVSRHDLFSDLAGRLRQPGPEGVRPPRPSRARSLQDGYASALEALAAGLDLRGARPERGHVAVVGYLMDRNEGDHRGNVAELERMLRGLGLEPASVWLSGRPYEHLREARRAEAVLSLPHGRAAARVLARRLGVRLVEAGLPFGLEGTRRFLELLGRACGRRKEAAAFIRRELDLVAPRLEWSVPHAFLNRRFVFAGDPHYGAAFAELIAELGGRAEPLGGSGKGPDADLLVADTRTLRRVRPRTAWLEFGFPCELTHILQDDPFLGFPGALGFLSRAANEVSKGFCRRMI
jgi:nitrogenase molybdenum-iron protein alpha/beta subunit